MDLVSVRTAGDLRRLEEIPTREFSFTRLAKRFGQAVVGMVSGLVGNQCSAAEGSCMGLSFEKAGQTFLNLSNDVGLTRAVGGQRSWRAGLAPKTVPCETESTSSPASIYTSIRAN